MPDDDDGEDDDDVFDDDDDDAVVEEEENLQRQLEYCRGCAAANMGFGVRDNA